MNNIIKKVVIVVFLLISVKGISQDYDEIKLAIKNIWHNNKDVFLNNINDNLIQNNTEWINITSEQTMNLLVYAHTTKNYMLLDEIAGIYLTAYPHLSLITGKTLTSSGVVFCEFEFQSPKYIWKHQNSDIDGYENILNSSQFLFTLSRTIHYALLIPENERNTLQNLNNFISNYSPVIIEHYNRWLTEDRSFQVKRESGCISGCFNHKEFLEHKLNNTLGDLGSFCNSVSNVDLMIVAGIAEILTSNSINPSDIGLLEDIELRFLEHVDLGTRLIEGRLFNNATLLDLLGNPLDGVIFDVNNGRSDHNDYQYAGNTDPTCPPSLVPVENISIDISHQRRFVHVFESLYVNKHVTNQSFPDVYMMQKLSNQFMYGVFNKDFEKPLFTNFSDGNNGWYLHGRNSNRSGNAPYDLSIAAITGGYCFWSKHNTDFENLRKALWEMIKSDNSEITSHVYNHYASYYSLSCERLEDIGIRDFHKPDALTHSVDLLQFLPTFFPVDNSVEDLIISIDCDNNTSIYKSESGNIMDREVYYNVYWDVVDMVSGDFDGDGDDELLTAFESTQGTVIYKSEDGNYPGGGSLSEVVYPSNTYWDVVDMVSGDFDGDGDGDDELLTAFKSPQGTVIYKNEDGNQLGEGNNSIKFYTMNSCSLGTITGGRFKKTDRSNTFVSKRYLEKKPIKDNFEMSVFPNPNNGMFYVSSSSGEIQRVEVFDLNGKKDP
ncbi:hypothetical protein [uncultured Aquimarina sp.]|uniref:hypothetical protein n=1 Tax=uncultured Aquimarina sp. TaxID=575652 RepID=UPI002638FE17|nr:hypothetical protein [uncultured Aquimarina sp.]